MDTEKNNKEELIGQDPREVKNTSNLTKVLNFIAQCNKDKKIKHFGNHREKSIIFRDKQESMIPLRNVCKIM